MIIYRDGKLKKFQHEYLSIHEPNAGLFCVHIYNPGISSEYVFHFSSFLELQKQFMNISRAINSTGGFTRNSIQRLIFIRKNLPSLQW